MKSIIFVLVFSLIGAFGGPLANASYEPNESLLEFCSEIDQRGFFNEADECFDRVMEAHYGGFSPCNDLPKVCPFCGGLPVPEGCKGGF